MKYTFLDTLVKMVIMIVVAIATVMGTFVTLGVIAVIGLGAIGIVSSGALTETSFQKTYLYGNQEAQQTIVSIPITGVIVGDDSDVSDPFGLMTESLTYGYEIKKTLAELAEDKTVEGVVLEINSPGGTIYGANAIAEGVAYYRQTANRPVYAFVSGLAASGGYWAAAGADNIYADVGTGIGSIGVISGPFQFFDGVVSEDGGAFVGGVVTQKGIETRYITAGTSKDLGNPYRKMTEQEVASLQQMVNNEYDTFVSFVSEQRKIPSETLRNSIGALVYDTKQAQQLGLIDSVSSREEVYETLADSLSLTTFKVVREEPSKGFLQTILESRSLLSPRTVSLCSLTKTHLVYHGDVASLCR